MEFLLIASAHFLALLSPGPDFFLLVQGALRLPTRYGLAISCGIAAANAIYLSLAVSGLEIIRGLAPLMSILKYAGAAYLLFIGIMLIRAPERTIETKPDNGFLNRHHFGHQFVIGFSSAILNPKNVIFYLSLFTVMVSDTTGFGVRCLYGLWMGSLVFLWDCGIILFIGRPGVRKRLGQAIFYIEKLSGTVLASFGLYLPFS